MPRWPGTGRPRPPLFPADGRQGYTAGSFDWIIATCSVPGIPDAWVDPLRPGGVLVTDEALGIEGGLVRLIRWLERLSPQGCRLPTPPRIR
ncbi:protein-L-isoaspartate O-methyltransferase [Streptomyces africanus]|uniref:Protein-L-isoaspartate O-methyltransferase n=1 Tax=Streptomyces africanus TaxID=231024 RepID=A0ABU0QMY3_9ACTN|nr:hypothetical protein [Streptomyces africanus]MDQ0748315.1 protein-L-isoaspartate O-methyltransferase [Streptomyces africanus]